jgi:hypothetical protein
LTIADKLRVVRDILANKPDLELPVAYRKAALAALPDPEQVDRGLQVVATIEKMSATEYDKLLRERDELAAALREWLNFDHRGQELRERTQKLLGEEEK